VIIARGLHVATICFLAAVGAATFTGTHAGSFYALGVVVAAGLLVYEHSLVSADDLSRLDAAFFTTNAFVSVILFATVGGGILLRP
jgi:4-hydroxybenzoate polyprenyltransferase